MKPLVWGRDFLWQVVCVSLDLAALAWQASACPVNDVFIYSWPHEFLSDLVTRGSATGMCEPVYSVENSLAECLRYIWPCEQSQKRGRSDSNSVSRHNCSVVFVYVSCISSTSWACSAASSSVVTITGASMASIRDRVSATMFSAPETCVMLVVN